jgi:hypothetical protein
MTASKKVHMLRCASSFVIATYEKYASFLRSRAPYLWSFLRSRPEPDRFMDFLGEYLR